VRGSGQAAQRPADGGTEPQHHPQQHRGGHCPLAAQGDGPPHCLHPGLLPAPPHGRAQLLCLYSWLQMSNCPNLYLVATERQVVLASQSLIGRAFPFWPDCKPCVQSFGLLQACFHRTGRIATAGMQQIAGRLPQSWRQIDKPCDTERGVCMV
jgi:hypothetical protein